MQLRVRAPKVVKTLPTSEKRRYRKKRFVSTIEWINFRIADQLIKNSSNPVRSFKIDNIPDSFRQYLEDEFSLKKRFTICRGFLDAFPIARCHQKDRSTRFYIDESTFSMKFNNTRSRTTHGIHGNQIYYSATGISIKFTKRRHHQFDSAALDIIAQFKNRK